MNYYGEKKEMLRFVFKYFFYYLCGMNESILKQLDSIVDKVSRNILASTELVCNPGEIDRVITSVKSRIVNIVYMDTQEYIKKKLRRYGMFNKHTEDGMLVIYVEATGVVLGKDLVLTDLDEFIGDRHTVRDRIQDDIRDGIESKKCVEDMLKMFGIRSHTYHEEQRLVKMKNRNPNMYRFDIGVANGHPHFHINVKIVPEKSGEENEVKSIWGKVKAYLGI